MSQPRFYDPFLIQWLPDTASPADPYELTFNKGEVYGAAAQVQQPEAAVTVGLGGGQHGFVGALQFRGRQVFEPAPNDESQSGAKLQGKGIGWEDGYEDTENRKDTQVHGLGRNSDCF